MKSRLLAICFEEILRRAKLTILSPTRMFLFELRMIYGKERKERAFRCPRFNNKGRTYQ